MTKNKSSALNIKKILEKLCFNYNRTSLQKNLESEVEIFVKNFSRGQAE